MDINNQEQTPSKKALLSNSDYGPYSLFLLASVSTIIGGWLSFLFFSIYLSLVKFLKTRFLKLHFGWLFTYFGWSG